MFVDHIFNQEGLDRDQAVVVGVMAAGEAFYVHASMKKLITLVKKQTSIDGEMSQMLFEKDGMVTMNEVTLRYAFLGADLRLKPARE